MEFILLLIRYILLICFHRVSRVSIKLFFNAFYASGLTNRLLLDLFLPDLLVGFLFYSWQGSEIYDVFFFLCYVTPFLDAMINSGGRTLLYFTHNGRSFLSYSLSLRVKVVYPFEGQHGRSS